MPRGRRSVNLGLLIPNQVANYKKILESARGGCVFTDFWGEEPTNSGPIWHVYRAIPCSLASFPPPFFVICRLLLVPRPCSFVIRPVCLSWFGGRLTLPVPAWPKRVIDICPPIV
jgi:hypothetical protein